MTETLSEAAAGHDEQTGGAPTPAGPRFNWRRLIGPVLIVALIALVWTADSRLAAGGWALALMLTLTFMKVPVGIAMAAAGIIGVFSIVGWGPTEGMLRRMPLESVASWSLSVVPMFILMGVLLWRSGMTEKLYHVGKVWLGWLPGGLAVGTHFGGAGMATITGSSFSILYTLGRAGIPEMIKAGYDKRLAVASVLSTGTLAHLIPPSLFLVIYAGIAEVPIGPALLAGAVPGVLLALMYVGTMIAVSAARPSLAGGMQRDRFSWVERWGSLRGVWSVPLLVLVVLGSMFTGVFTATEAGAAGAFGALLILLWELRRRRPFAVILEALLSTVTTVGSLFLLLIGAHILSRMVTVSGLGSAFVDFVVEIELDRVGFLVLLGIAYIVLGMFMDALALMLITVPLLLPVLGPLGISEIWFGVFVVIFAELAVITPPVGVLSFTMAQIVRDKEVNQGVPITLGNVFQAAGMVLPITLLLVALLIAFPGIALWLPSLMAG